MVAPCSRNFSPSYQRYKKIPVHGKKHRQAVQGTAPFGKVCGKSSLDYPYFSNKFNCLNYVFGGPAEDVRRYRIRPRGHCMIFSQQRIDDEPSFLCDCPTILQEIRSVSDHLQIALRNLPYSKKIYDYRSNFEDS